MTEHVLGIDFGTSRCAMAWLNPRTGEAEVILNAEGESHTPSLVYWGKEQRLVGKPALQILKDEGGRAPVLAGVKRDLGRRIRYPTPGHPAPVEAAAEILRKLRHDAETYHFHGPVSRAVVTHPVSFSELEKERLRAAALDAGFAHVDLLEEPVAAAVAYTRMGLRVQDPVLVYDLGAGTFDLAVLARDPATSEFRPVLPPRGLRRGGDDFDRALYDHCDAIARRELGRPLNQDGEVDLDFLLHCREQKESLSLPLDRPRRFSFLLTDAERGILRFVHEIDRAAFERLIEEDVEATVRETGMLLQAARTAGREVQSLVLIGGSARVPAISQRLEASVGLAPLKWEKMDLAVVLGAAYHAVRAPGEPAGGPTVTPVRGEDVRATLRLTAAEARQGCGKVVGEGDWGAYVMAPPGSRDGEVVRLQGRGKSGTHGGAPGDLLVTLRVAPEPVRGEDVAVSVRLTPEEARQGCQKQVSVNGRPETVTLPAGVSEGEQLRLRGRGRPGRHAGEAGDCVISVQFQSPAPTGPPPGDPSGGAVDYYETLGVERSATEEQIRAAYRRLARQFHPDVNPGNPAAAARFEAVSRAYEVLSNSEARDRYDRFGVAAVSGAQESSRTETPPFAFGANTGNTGAGGMEDLFASLFGTSLRQPQSQQPVAAEMTLSLEEAFHGGPRSVRLSSQEACPTCQGTGAESGARFDTCPHCKGSGRRRGLAGFFSQGEVCPQCQGARQVPARACPTCRGHRVLDRSWEVTVTLPPGVEDGAQITLPGQGSTGGPARDLVLTVRLRPHPVFTRQGDVLRREITISPERAVQGGEVSVETLTGWVTLRIPPGIRSGQVLRLRGQGMPRPAGGHGDLFVRVTVS